MWLAFPLRKHNFVCGGSILADVGSICVERVVGADEPGTAVNRGAPKRDQSSLLMAGERVLIIRLCRLMPDWVTSDHLTAVGALGAALACAGYVASNWRPSFLFLASLGLLVNWFGDSLDGSLARHRGTERPRYGYFLDHSVDAINNLIFAVGLGASPYVSMDAALFLLVSYYLLSMYVFLYNEVAREFRLTFLYCGPTELRLLTIAFNLFVFFEGPVKLSLLGMTVSLYTLLVELEAAVFVAIFIYTVLQTSRTLKQEEDDTAALETVPGVAGHGRAHSKLPKGDVERALYNSR
jgi:phosphatidylglycerophosphate synthase